MKDVSEQLYKKNEKNKIESVFIIVYLIEIIVKIKRVRKEIA